MEDFALLLAAKFCRRGEGGDYTKLWEEFEPAIKGEISEDIDFEKEEIAVIGYIPSPHRWMVLTTKRLIWKREWERGEIRLKKLAKIIPYTPETKGGMKLKEKDLDGEIDLSPTEPDLTAEPLVGQHLKVYTRDGEIYALHLEPHPIVIQATRRLLSWLVDRAKEENK